MGITIHTVIYGANIRYTVLANPNYVHLVVRATKASHLVTLPAILFGTGRAADIVAVQFH